MKRMMLILAQTLFVGVTPLLSQPIPLQAPPVEAPHIGEGGLPQFEISPNFFKVPAKWTLGHISDVAVDADDNIWILSRPKEERGRAATSAQPSAMAPPVMEFDKDGNFIRGWGGESGPGYQWPSNEHGITVDSAGFLWIVGNADGKRNNPANLPNDNQILKFTKEGKFVMAIGKSGQVGSNATEVLRGADGLHVYPKTRELFVSDGYGNSRVMVYDADRGKFKRMFGAYGNKPLDTDARPPVPSSEPNPLCPMICGTWSALQQFEGPHDVTVSSDGLVYVIDRGNKRIQVFTTDGKFIAEQFIGLDSKFNFEVMDIAFSPDERFLYIAGHQVIRILNRRTLEVLGMFDMRKEQVPAQIHLLATDHKGNIYAVMGGGKSVAPAPYKMVFKGYSTKTPCPPCLMRVDKP